LDVSLAELGVDSLKVLELQTRLEEKLAVRLSGDFFSWTTASGDTLIEALLSAWQQRDAGDSKRITPGPFESETAASSGQQRLFILEKLSGGVPVYNVQFGVRISGALDIAKLQRALDELVKRHAVLRAVFVERDGFPYQVVETENRIEPEFADLSETPFAEHETRLEALAYEQASLPFDLLTGPLTRVKSVKLTSTDFALLFTQHHIITDGWSIEQLITELAELYGAMCDDTLPKPPPQLEFADFARWELKNIIDDENAKAFWADKLSELPRLDLPFDLPPPQVRSYKGGRLRFQISHEVSDGLLQLSAEHGCTPFVTLLAAYAVLLHRYTGQDDFAIGSVNANRFPEVRDVLGFFANTVVLRFDLTGEPDFLELLQRTRSVIAQALHREGCRRCANGY
jgi:hypothetical protein